MKVGLERTRHRIEAPRPHVDVHAYTVNNMFLPAITTQYAPSHPCQAFSAVDALVSELKLITQVYSNDC